MATEAKESGAKEAESLAQSILGVLGLPDIIIGSLTLYAANHFSDGNRTAAFHSTGIAFADGALLACASALVGKCVVLLVNIPMGLHRICFRHSTRGKKFRDRLTAYSETVDAKAHAKSADPLQLAMAVIAQDLPNQFEAITKIRRDAIFLLSSVLVAILCWVQLGTAYSKLRLVFAASASVLLVYGWAHLQDYANTIMNAFSTLADKRSRDAQAAQAAQQHTQAAQKEKIDAKP